MAFSQLADKARDIKPFLTLFSIIVVIFAITTIATNGKFKFKR